MNFRLVVCVSLAAIAAAAGHLNAASACPVTNPEQQRLLDALTHEGVYYYCCSNQPRQQQPRISADVLHCALTKAATTGSVFISGVDFGTSIDLSNAEVRPSVTFDNCKFESDFRALNATFDHNLQVTRGADPASNWDISGSTFHGDLALLGVHLGRLVARDINVSGTLDLAPDALRCIDLSYATTSVLEWRTLPKLGLFAISPPLADDMTFKHTTFRNAGTGKDAGQEFFRNVKFSAPLFNQYEHQLRDRGADRQADRIFLLMHSRLRSTVGWTEPVTDWLYGVFFGYGRFAKRPLVWSTAFIALGWLLFWDAESRGMMERADPKAEVQILFSSFWYSLELYLPFVDLGVAKAWRPKGGFHATYARVHQFAGWVLIPIAIGAITGATK